MESQAVFQAETQAKFFLLNWVPGLGQLGLLVQEGEDPLRLGLHQIDAILENPIIDPITSRNNSTR